jgi:hypothetical protein
MKKILLILICLIALEESYCQSFTYDAFLMGEQNSHLTSYPVPITIKSYGKGMYIIEANGFNGQLKINDTIKFDQFNQWEELYRYKGISKTVFDKGSDGRIELTTYMTFTTKFKMSDFANGLNINSNTVSDDFEINIENKTVHTISSIPSYRDEKYSYITIVPYLNGNLNNKKNEVKQIPNKIENNKIESEQNPIKGKEQELKKAKSLNIDLSDPIVVGATKFKQSTTFSELVFIPNYPNKVNYPSKIESFIEQEHLSFNATYENGRSEGIANSVDDFTIAYNVDGNGEWLGLFDKNIYFIGQYDFDKDNIGEIIIATRLFDFENEDKFWETTIELNVYKYNITSKRNWEKVGNLKGYGIAGEPKAFITENRIRIPRNARGFYYELTWNNNKFNETGYY